MNAEELQAWLENADCYRATPREWAELINSWAELKGWNGERDQAEWAALAHTEISEAYEEHRNGHKPTEIFLSSPDGKPEGMAIEYADLLIRVLHWFAAHGIDPNQSLRLKMQYNLTRPFRHGGKVA